MKQETKQTPLPSIHEEGKFTKGEWVKYENSLLTDQTHANHPIIKNTGNAPLYRNSIKDKNRTLIANAYGSTKEEAEANAALIAECKSLYYFIKRFINTCDEREKLSGDFVSLKTEAKEILSRIK